MTQPIILTDDLAVSESLTKLRDLSLRPAAVRRAVAEMTTLVSKHVAKKSPAVGEKIAVIVVLRSGLAMMEPFVDTLGDDADVVVYHLGLFRERHTLSPVEYYNKLPPKDPKIKHAYILDPLVATGGTAEAAINILRDWGVENVTFVALLGSEKGLQRAAGVWPEGAKVIVGAADQNLDTKGYVKPGVGDIGDRLYGTSLN
ncbi:Fc.00g115670.m01.CDS01 [Cosmosporella sp. VM-42]